MSIRIVDDNARWVEIQAKAKEIAYREDPPSGIESMLCWTVERIKELQRDAGYAAGTGMKQPRSGERTS